MSEPNREHIEAVDEMFHEVARELQWTRLSELAEALLTSTDPAVLDAMQDALVRAGRLTEQRTEWGVMFHDGSVRRNLNGRTAKSRAYSEAGRLAFMLEPDNIRPARRRVFVTEWTEATSAS